MRYLGIDCSSASVGALVSWPTQLSSEREAPGAPSGPANFRTFGWVPLHFFQELPLLQWGQRWSTCGRSQRRVPSRWSPGFDPPPFLIWERFRFAPFAVSGAVGTAGVPFLVWIFTSGSVP